MTAIASIRSVGLEVREIPEVEERWMGVAQEVKKWFGLAKEKWRKAKEEGMDRQQFFDSQIVLDDIYPQLELDASKREDVVGLWICTLEGGGSVEGVAIMVKKTGYVRALATHPKNLRHPLNDLEERVGGVGRALIHALAIHSVTIEKSLTLQSLRMSIGFYQKWGFEITGGRDHSPDMELTLEKCRAMVKERRLLDGTLQIAVCK